MPALNANWNNLEVFLHFPAAAVSKDGPSAGIAILSALLSSFYAVPVN
jgi:ATP-dependent Lon protease